MKKIVNVEIVREETIEKSGIGRAAVGGLIFGPVGAIVGALSKKDDQLITFRVTYNKGKPDIVKAKKGTFVYKMYMDFVDRGC